MTFPNMDVLKLEVERAPVTGELVNLVENPSGQYGAWGWITPVPATSLTVVPGNLNYEHVPSSVNYCYTESYEVSVGERVGASWKVPTATHGAGVPVTYEATIEFLDVNGAVDSSKSSALLQDETTTQYIDPFLVPAGVTHARLRFDWYSSSLRTNITAAAATIHFNSATLVHAPTSAELSTINRLNRAPNPSFQTNLAGWTGTGCTRSRVTTPAPVVGTHSLRMVSTVNGAMEARLTIDIPSNGRYMIAVQARSAATPRDFVVKAGVLATGQYVESAPVTTTTSGWTLLEFESWMRFNYDTLVVRFPTTVIGETHYVDAVILEDAATYDGTYFDGDTADVGTERVYAWVGTAHDSVSSLTSYAPYTDGLWQDVLAPTHELSISRNALDVGTLTGTIIDEDLDPSASTTVRPGRRIRLFALEDATGEFTRLFEGKIDDAKVTYVGGTRIALTASDNVAQLANATQTLGVGTIDDLRWVMEGNGVPWVVNGDSNQIAMPTVVSTNDNASVLDQIVVTRDSNLGFAWVDRENVLQAWDAASMPTTPVGTFDESVYSDLDVSFNSDAIINEVRVRWLRYLPTAGTTSEVVYGPYVDTDSVKTWGYHSAEFTMHGATEDAGSIGTTADAVLTANANPVISINSVTVPIRTAADISTSKALVDLFDLCTLEYAPTSTVDSSRVTSVEHHITPTSWVMHLGFEVDGAVATPRRTPAPTAATTAESEFAWHYVGDAGEPPFLNGWANEGGVNTPLRFRKDRAGNLQIQGQIDGSGTLGAAIFVLPAEFRPPENIRGQLAYWSNRALNTINVDANGDVMTHERFVFAPGGSNSWIGIYIVIPLEG